MTDRPNRPRVVALALALAACASAGALTATAAASAPRLRAKAAIVVDQATGQVIYSRHSSRRRPIASATKLMTALLTLEHLKLSRRVRVPPYHAAVGESTVGLRPGERLSVRDLLRALLLPSANDAAATLAHGVSRSERAFVGEMNRRARELRLSRTHYTTPVGLDDPDNYSSAADLVALARVDLSNSFFASTVRRAHATLHSGAHRRRVTNRNGLVARHHWVTGVKTGHTRSAGFVLVGSASRGGASVVSAALGDPGEAARDADSLALLRYGLRAYRARVVVGQGRVVARAAVRGGAAQTVPLVVGAPVRVRLLRGATTTVSVARPRSLRAPIPAGARAGSLTLRVGGAVVARVPLQTARAVPRAGTATRLGRALGTPLGIGVLAALCAVLGGSLLAVMLRRRVRRREQRPEVGAA